MFSSFGTKSMERLEKNIGQKAEVCLVARKFPLSILGEIEDVKRFRFVKVKNISILRPLNIGLAALVKQGSIKIPFVWPGSAIQKIENDEILYDNCWIKNDYDQNDPKKVPELAEILYGKDIADNLVELKQVIENNEKNIFKIYHT